MATAKFLMILFYFVGVVIGLLLVVNTCTATSYTVGGTSGWDISSDIDSWVEDKKFEVGDVLVFQYSSYHSVSEVKKESYDGCNVTKNVIQSSNDGNTTIPLSKPGERYFVCGNVLHCLSGMKLHVTVNQNQAANSPANAPQASTQSGEGGAPSLRPSNKKNQPTVPVASSYSGFVINNGGMDCLVLTFICVIGTVLSLFVI